MPCASFNYYGRSVCWADIPEGPLYVKKGDCGEWYAFDPSTNTYYYFNPSTKGSGASSTFGVGGVQVYFCGQWIDLQSFINSAQQMTGDQLASILTSESTSVRYSVSCSPYMNEIIAPVPCDSVDAPPGAQKIALDVDKCRVVCPGAQPQPGVPPGEIPPSPPSPPTPPSPPSPPSPPPSGPSYGGPTPTPPSQPPSQPQPQPTPSQPTQPQPRIGGLGLLALIAGGAYLLLRRKRR